MLMLYRRARRNPSNGLRRASSFDFQALIKAGLPYLFQAAFIVAAAWTSLKYSTQNNTDSIGDIKLRVQALETLIGTLKIDNAVLQTKVNALEAALSKLDKSR